MGIKIKIFEVGGGNLVKTSSQPVKGLCRVHTNGLSKLSGNCKSAREKGGKRSIRPGQVVCLYGQVYLNKK